MRSRELLQPSVEREDLLGRPAHGLHDGFAVAQFVIADGQDGSEHDVNAVRCGEFGYRPKVIFDGFERHWTGVAGEIVRAGEYHDDSWFERDHVGAKANEHLRRGLAADAAIDVGLAGKEAAVDRVVP